jgi:hypothetical protein
MRVSHPALGSMAVSISNEKRIAVVQALGQGLGVCFAVGWIFRSESLLAMVLPSVAERNLRRDDLMRPASVRSSSYDLQSPHQMPVPMLPNLAFAVDTCRRAYGAAKILAFAASLINRSASS